MLKQKRIRYERVLGGGPAISLVAKGGTQASQIAALHTFP